MKNTKYSRTKKFLFLCHWGVLCMLVASFMMALFWEENLPIQSGDHILLAIGILGVFYYLLYRWNFIHETNYGNIRHHKTFLNSGKPTHQIESDRFSEKM
jgi:hypothetical protein